MSNKKNGRPTIFNEELESEILRRICEGESVNSIFNDDSMPNPSTFYQWRLDNESFSNKCARAIGDRKLFIVDQMVDIADDLAKEADESTTQIDVNIARLQIEARDKKLARMAPRKEEKDPNTDIAAAMLALASKLPD